MRAPANPAAQRGLLTALLLVLLALHLSSTAEAHGTKGSYFEVIDSYWGTIIGRGDNTPYQVAEAKVAPGDKDVVLIVRARYVGNYSQIANIKAMLFLSPPFTSVNPENITSYYASSVSMGEVFPLQFRMNIPSNVSLGEHRFNLSISFDSIYNVSATRGGYAVIEKWEKLSKPVNESLEVPVQLLGRVTLHVEATSIQLGNLTLVKVKVGNIGCGNASDLKAGLVAPAGSNIRILEQYEKSLGDLTANSTAEASFKVYVPIDEAQPELQLRLRYKDPYGEEVQEEYTLYLFISSREPKILLSAEPTILVSGAMNNVTLRIRNLYAYPLKDTIATITAAVSTRSQLLQLGVVPQSKAVIVGHEVKWIIGDLPPNAEANLTLKVYVPTEASSVSLSVGLSYIDSGGVVREEQSSLEFPAVGSLELMISDYSTYPEVVANGTSFTLTVTMLNLGTEDARFIVVEAANETGTPFTPLKPYVYVGDLSSGSSTAFSLQFKVDEEASAGLYEVRLIVKCTDRLHVRHIKEFKVPVYVSVFRKAEVQPTAATPPLHAYLAAVLAAAGGGAVGYFVGRRSKRGIELEA